MNRLVLLVLALLLASSTVAHAQRIPVTTDSDDARTHYVRGLHNAMYLNFDRARPHFDAALEADPDFALAHLYRGWLSPSDKRAEHMRQAKAAAATEAERQMIDGYEAQLREEYDRQHDLLTALAERYPDDPLPMFFLASTASFNRGQDAEAVDLARRALGADPSFAAAYNVIGYAEMAKGDMAAAEKAFREQIRLAPDEPNPYDSYGEFLLEQGKFDEAERQFELALAKDPGFEVSRTNLARVGIMRSDRRFGEAVAAGDVDALAALYTENAIIMPPDSPVIQGRDAIREYMAGLLAAGIDGVEITPVEVVRVDDDMAVERAEIEISAGGQVVDHGKSLVVWRLVDGEWLYVRDMWSSNGKAAMEGTH